MPKNGRVAEPGFNAVAPGSGVLTRRQFLSATMCQQLGIARRRRHYNTKAMLQG